MSGENDTKSGDQQSAGDMQALQAQLAELQKEKEELKSAKEALERRLEDADKELLSEEYLEFLESKKGASKKEPSKDTSEEVDLDEMTPSQLAKYFEERAKGNIEKAISDITKRIENVENTIGVTLAQVDLSIAAIKHKDFGEALDTPVSQRTPEQKLLVETVYKVAKENPTWNAEKCLRQARIEIKAQQEELELQEKEKAEKERKALTEKGGVSSFTLQGKQLSKDEAAEKAWKAAFGNKQSLD